MKPLALLVALALCAGVVLWRSIDDGSAPARAEPAAPPETKIVAATVVRSPPSSAPVLAPPPPLERPLAPERELDREAAEAVTERRDRLHARFVAEAVDASWASTATQMLSDDLGTHLTADVRLAGVECRTTICRAELAPTTPDAGQQFVQTWIRHRSWTGRGFAAGDGDRVVVYVARPDRGEAFAN
jgi:hypothetical protein